MQEEYQDSRPDVAPTAALEPFDPTADMGFDDYVEYVPPIEKPEDYDAPAAPVEVPAPERIAATFRGLPGNEKLLLHLIDFCREERDADEVHAEARAFIGGGVCTYEPEVLCASLVRAGALGIIGEETAGETEGEPPVEAGAPDATAAGETEALAPVGAPPRFAYRATADGLAVVDAQDPEGDRLRFLEEGERYHPVYALVLQACAAEAGATKKELDGLVDHHPLCKQPRRYSGFFVKGLEGIDAIAFDGAWKTTAIGRDILSTLPTDETN